MLQASKHLLGLVISQVPKLILTQVVVVLIDNRIDSNLIFGALVLTEQSERVERFFERMLLPADGIVNFGMRSVNAQCDRTSRYPKQTLNFFFIEQRTIGGQRDSNPECMSILHQEKSIFSHKDLSSRKMNFFAL